MTREEAIQYWEGLRKTFSSQLEKEEKYWGRMHLQTTIDAIDKALSALRQQETVAKCNDLYDEDGGEILPKKLEMTLDDAISHLDDTLSDTSRKWSCESCRMEHVQLRSWLAELRDIKQEHNEPLTLDELRKMDGEPVWVEFQNGSGGKWGIVHITMFNQIVFANGLHCTIGEPYYGKTWLAYRKKPEEADHA